MRRVFILGNPNKDGIDEAMERVRAIAGNCCDVVGEAKGFDGKVAIEAGAEFITVVGGDGTLLTVCRSLRSNQLPLVGINFGKLGFLAEFSIDEFEKNLPTIVKDDQFISELLTLKICVKCDDSTRAEGIAVNDVVVHAGPPFRIIRLAVRINGMDLTTVGGDGLILCTPTGSTAHNMSAGGPLMLGGTQGIGITPVCPHSLSHRPVVVDDEAKIEIVVEQANEGTYVTVDGQSGVQLQVGDRLCVERHEANFRLVRNPAYPKWHGLVTKLNWGQSPRYGG